MSLYSEYLRERTNMDYYEIPDKGFIVYSWLGENEETGEPDRVYLVDIFVRSDFRKDGIATELAEYVYKQADKNRIGKAIGSVDITAKNAGESMKVLLAHGMRPDSFGGNMIWFSKYIGDRNAST